MIKILKKLMNESKKYTSDRMLYIKAPSSKKSHSHLIWNELIRKVSIKIHSFGISSTNNSTTISCKVNQSTV